MTITVGTFDLHNGTVLEHQSHFRWSAVLLNTSCKVVPRFL